MQDVGGAVFAIGNVMLRFHECQFVENTAVRSLDRPLALPSSPLVSLSICCSIYCSICLSVHQTRRRGRGFAGHSFGLCPASC